MRGRVSAVLLLLFTFAATAFADCTLGLTYSAQFRTTAFDVAVAGDDLWVATGYGLQLFDRRSDPPSLIAYAAVPELTRLVRARGSVAYAGSGSSIVVAQRNGSRIDIVRRIDAGATVQALLLDGTQLFVGTAAGITRFDVADATNPVASSGTFPTSLPGVTSLAIRSGELFAADGDQSVEIFNITGATPVKSGTLSSLPRSISVATTGNILLVSDGQQTEVFALSAAAPLKVATRPFGASSFAAHTGSVFFVAGQDRHVVAADFTAPGSPVPLFEVDVPISAGSINRVSAMASTSDRLYVAAGDAGLLTWNTSRFTSPYPLRAYPSPAVSSIAAVDTGFFGGTSSGLVEFRRTTGTTLTEGRAWSTGAHTVHAATNDGFLLTSIDRVVTYWTTKSTTPTSIWSATFAKPVVQATVVASTVYALLSDGTVWSASLQTAPGTPVAVNVAGGAQSSMARSGNAFVFAQVNEAGTTTVRFYPNGDFSVQPSVATIQGAPTTPIALDGVRAALFTFRGLSVIDFSGPPVVTELPQSNQLIAVALAISGNKLLELTSRELVVWDLVTRAVDRRYTFPGEGLSLALADANVAAVGTSTSTVAVSYTSASQLPTAYSVANPNSYYRKAAMSGERLALLATGRVDIFSFSATRSPQFSAAILAPGVIDLAASSAGVFTLAGNGSVTAWTSAGQQVATATLNEGSDAVPLAIHATAGAVFVSISRGCLSGGCEKKTIVMNPQTLATTASMTGAIVDLAVDGTRAWVITDLPAEIRRLDLADALHPSIAATRAIEGNAASLAHNGTTLYALSDRLYAYRDGDLAALSQQFPTTSVSNPMVRTINGCGVVSRNGAATLYDTANPSAWSGASVMQLPAPARSIAVSPTRLIVLTDYSIEVYGGTTGAVRRRATR